MAAVEIGTAFVSLIPSLKGFSGKAQSELSRSGIGAAVGQAMTSEVTRAGSRAGGLFSRAFAAAQARGGSGVYVAGLIRNLRTYAFALSGITAATIGFGLKTASSLEQARVAFTTMLGSAKAAGAFITRLLAFARKTPFDFPGVVTASQKLLAFGFTAKQVLPTLTSLGDAAAGLSLGTEGLDRLTTAVGQIQAKGRVQSDELLQLTEAGVPALKILANELGTTTANVQALVTKGLIPASTAIPALLRGLETGTDGLAGPTAKFGGLMAKQSRTLGGIFSNLKDTVSQGLARAVRPLVPVLKREIPQAMKALPGIFAGAAHALGEFLHGLGVARDRSKGVSTGFERFGSVIAGVTHAVRATFGFISRNAKIFGPLAAGILGAVVALKAFNIVMAITNAIVDANPISLVVLALGALAVGLVYAYKKSETFRDIVKGVFHVLEVVVGHAVSYVVHYFKFMADVWLTVVGTIVHAASAMFGWVPGVGGKLKSAAAAFDRFKSSVDGTLSAIADNASGWGSSAGGNFTNGFLAGVTNALASIPSAFKDKFSQFDTGSGAFGGGAWTDKKKTKTAFKPIGSAIGDGLSDGIKQSSDKVGKNTSSLVDKILTPLRDLLAKAKQLASSVTQTILGDTGFGALLNNTDAFGETGFGTSVKGIIAGFVAQRRDVRQFRRELRLLGKRGLSDAAIREIAGEGLEQGGAVAASLLGATRKQLHRISNLRGDVHQGARGIGTDIASARFGAQISRELVKTQRAIEKASEKTELGPKTMGRLEGALKHTAHRSKVYLDTSQLDRHDGAVVAGLL